MISYGLGLAGMWIFIDGYISIVICHRWTKEVKTWKFDHSIRIIRMIIGIGMMVTGWLIG